MASKETALEKSLYDRIKESTNPILVSASETLALAPNLRVKSAKAFDERGNVIRNVGTIGLAAFRKALEVSGTSEEVAIVGTMGSLRSTVKTPFHTFIAERPQA